MIERVALERDLKGKREKWRWLREAVEVGRSVGSLEKGKEKERKGFNSIKLILFNCV